MQCHPLMSRALGLLVPLMLALGASAASAQGVHRCTDANNRVFWSDKPCPGNGATRITSYGPAPTRDTSSSYQPPLQKAPDHLKYLSQECAFLNDAMRTATARGVGNATQRELSEEYMRKCRDNDHDARRRVNDEETQRRVQSREQVVAQQRQREQDAASVEQCREMGRIVAERRKKQDTMTAGERGDFERFQANFNDRCRGR